MLILGLDTATPWGTIAVSEDEEILFEISLKAGKGSGEYLLASLERYLGKIGKDIRDIQLIVTGTGPGSYTGIRVGLATAAGLAEGLHIPVYQLSTLRIIAENCRYSSKWVAPVIDARREEVYAAIYESGPMGLKPVKEASSEKVVDFAAFCANTYPEVVICGDGSKKYREQWECYTNLTIAPAAWDKPSAGLAARIAFMELAEGRELPVAPLMPSYIKRVEAEIRWEEKILGSQRATDDHRGT